MTARLTIYSVGIFSMIRIVLLILVAVVLGTALGSFKFGNSTQEQFYLVDSSKVPELKTTSENVGVPVIEFPEGTVYKFGTMKHGTKLSHKFPIKNVGTAPLMIEKTGSTCKCTVGNLEKGVLMPGEQQMIELEWHGKSVSASFGQSATFKTNAVQHSEIKLEIQGAVIDSFVFKPSEINLGDFTSEDGTSREFTVFCYTEGVDLGKLEWSNPDTAKFMKLSKEPTSTSEDPDHVKALKAYRVKLDVQPGIRVGLFSGNVLLHTNGGEDVDKLVLKVSGRSVSDMTIIGGRFYDSETGIMKIENVKPSEGFTTTLWLVLRGPEHDNIEVTLDQPEAKDTLKVSLGKKKTESEVKRTLIPINFEVPKDAPQVTFSGTGEGTFLKIMLRANSSKPVELPIHVRLTFAN